MSKLTLRIEDLEVDSFSTFGELGPRGTVMAQSDTYRLSWCAGYCTEPYKDSEDGFCPSAGGTCPNGCNSWVECPTGGYTCNGATACGTCGGEATCDLQEGCSGTSFDMQIC